MATARLSSRRSLSGDHVYIRVCAGGGDGADVLPLAGAVGPRVDEIEVTGLVMAVFAPVGSGQDRLESSGSLSSRVYGTGK